jgi:hypothetical protein
VLDRSGRQALPSGSHANGAAGFTAAKQLGVNPGTVQRISRPFEQDAVAP